MNGLGKHEIWPNRMVIKKARYSSLMRTNRILCLGVALVLPQLALAKLPFTNDAFGKVEGTLDFCVQVDPAATPKYQERKKVLELQGKLDEERKKVEALELKLKSSERSEIFAIENWTVFEFPNLASLSITGPPGYGNPKSFATLS